MTQLPTCVASFPDTVTHAFAVLIPGIHVRRLGVVFYRSLDFDINPKIDFMSAKSSVLGARRPSLGTPLSWPTESHMLALAVG